MSSGRGWLQREFRDGLIWKTLRVQAEKGETLSPAATTDRDAWLKTLPSAAWSERYGGGWDDVDKLMAASRREREAEAEREEAARLGELAEARARRAEDARRLAITGGLLAAIALLAAGAAGFNGYKVQRCGARNKPMQKLVQSVTERSRPIPASALNRHAMLSGTIYRSSASTLRSRACPKILRVPQPALGSARPRVR